jgi:hypothetical protein
MTRAEIARWQRIIGAKQDGHYGPKTVELSRTYLADLGLQLSTDKPTPELIEMCEAKLILELASNTVTE